MEIFVDNSKNNTDEMISKSVKKLNKMADEFSMVINLKKIIKILTGIGFSKLIIVYKHWLSKNM